MPGRTFALCRAQFRSDEKFLEFLVEEKLARELLEHGQETKVRPLHRSGWKMARFEKLSTNGMVNFL